MPTIPLLTDDAIRLLERIATHPHGRIRLIRASPTPEMHALLDAGFMEKVNPPKVTHGHYWQITEAGRACFASEAVQRRLRERDARVTRARFVIAVGELSQALSTVVQLYPTLQPDDQREYAALYRLAKEVALGRPAQDVAQ